MKKRFLYFIFSIILTTYGCNKAPKDLDRLEKRGEQYFESGSSSGYTGNVIQYQKKKPNIISLKGTLKDGRLDGKVIEYYKEGKIKRELNYKDGKRHGEYIGYYSNGNKSQINRFVNGDVVGTSFYYFENGDLESKNKIINGKLLYNIEYNRAGFKIYEFKVLNLKKDQYISKTFYSNGKIQSEQNFKKKKLHGDQLVWGMDGKKVLHKKYKNGILDSTIKKYEFPLITDVERFKFLNKVKSMTELVFKIKSNKKQENSKPELKKTLFFNKMGQIKKEKIYNTETGKISKIIDITYNTNNKKETEIHKFPNDKKSNYKIKYKYENNQLLKYKYVYTMEDKQLRYSKYIYDPDLKFIIQEFYDFSGKYQKSEKKIYRNDYCLIKLQKIDTSNNISSEFTYGYDLQLRLSDFFEYKNSNPIYSERYDYSPNGNLISQYNYDHKKNKTDIYEIKEYEYDQKYNWISRKIYHSDKTYKIHHRSFEYY